jgi:probable H4MPT-linked C1 transfer pathway protein
VVIGWDIGGVNTKVALVDSGCLQAVRERPFELQRDPGGLRDVLQALAADVAAPSHADHAVTMTAELSQLFRTKREGVSFVLDAVEQAFPAAVVCVFTVDGRFVSAAAARLHPLDVAAANWMATAMVVARHHPDAILIDMGTTTTDIVPIVSGRVVATGRTDLDRLTTGELCYTGAVRTPVEAIVQQVDVRGRRVAVSAEGFALAGDVHVWRGDLSPAQYDATTPDGRASTRPFAGERLRRLVCADREMLTDDDVSSIADSVARAQVAQVVDALQRVRRANPAAAQAVVGGRGAFVAAAAARESGLEVWPLSAHLGVGGAQSAPAVAVAMLADAAAERSPECGRSVASAPSNAPPALVDVVVKVGGGMLVDPGDLEAVCAALDAMVGRRVLVVPGGGPFADAVRDVDRRHGLGHDTAHWMAIRAMDVFAEQVASRLTRGVLVDTADDVRAAVLSGRLAVLAPFRWLRASDALPHSWDVTGDSIAAWLANETGASDLVLIKPRGARNADLADRFFDHVRSRDVRASFVFPDELDGERTIWPEPPGSPTGSAPMDGGRATRFPVA